MDLIRIFVGYDPRESVAYHVCCQSIIDNATRPVQITPLDLRHLTGYDEKHKDGSNAFIYSRFLVPYLCGYSGWALFVDGDMVFNDDVARLWGLRNEWMAAQVVQHAYQTKHKTKYLGAKNEDYPRKNWSSVILWNCAHYANKKLTPDFVGAATGAELHRFTWIPDERLGALPPTWNHLVMESPAREDASLYHYTVGTPCFKEFKDCDNSSKWWNVYERMRRPLDGDQ